MNIREHIEAGHYPLVDDKGRPLVPIGCNRSATICATDAPGKKPILGFIDGCGDVGMTCSYVLWDEHGNNTPSQPGACWVDIQPPPPRKVKVTAWAQVISGGGRALYWTKPEAEEACRDYGGRVVELSSEYEEPWL